MRPIRAFLFAQGENGQWGCQVFRDFEPLLEAAIKANNNKENPVGVHVGFERPDTEAVADLLSRCDQLVFLSNGALGTMPAPIFASAASIGSAGGVAFHVALDGFGYHIEDPAISAAQAAPPKAESLSNSALKELKGWVVTLAKLQPELASKLSAVGICDDDTYRQRESVLDLDSRFFVGIHRYEILVGKQPNSASIVEHLRSAPPWLLEAPIALLNLSVRSSNVCVAHDIRIVGDFARFEMKKDLLKLPNLGRKSFDEICREMLQLFKTGQPLRASSNNSRWDRPAHLDSVETDRDNDGENDSNETEKSHLEGLPVYSYSNLNEGFVEVTQRLTEKERRILAGRIGFRCEPMTLQQLADQIHRTRERVRQIEIKIFRKLQSLPFWEELSRRMLDHLSGRTSPLFLSGLPAIDPWFEGAGELHYALREVFDHMPRLGLHIITWNDAHVVSRLNQSQWLESLEQAKVILMGLVNQSLREDEVISQVAGILAGKGDDMRDALWEEVSQYCIWSNDPNEPRILTGFGKSTAALVSSILQESENPLHIDEIMRRAQQDSAYEAINMPNIHRAAAEVSLLYGRRTYGLMKHCPLTPSQMLSVRAEVEDIIAGGSPSKQWHSNELCDELLNRGFSFEGKLTKYVINFALADSPNLVYLGRMIWGVRGKWSENRDARLDVKQAVISLVENEGKPMTTAQIRSRLIEGRGLNAYFQIGSSSPLVRISPGLWGLEGRDVDMAKVEASAYRLLKELSLRQEGMHASEVAAFLGLGSEDTVWTLVSIAQKDGLRMDKGQYCYLQPWGESRRVSVWVAATSILKSHDKGLPRSELQLYVERMTKRKVDRQQLSSVLQNIDATYDSESSRWKYSGRVSEEDESDEGTSNVPLTM